MFVFGAQRGSSAGVCSVSYRPSGGGSAPLEPDWARLMYRFNSLSWGWRNRQRMDVKKCLSVCSHMVNIWIASLLAKNLLHILVSIE